MEDVYLDQNPAQGLKGTMLMNNHRSTVMTGGAKTEDICCKLNQKTVR